MKLSSRLAALFLAPALLTSACGVLVNEKASVSLQDRMEDRCAEIVYLYDDIYISAEKEKSGSKWDDPVLCREAIDEIEKVLSEAGLDVIDTDKRYPAYLTTADNFYDFWNGVQKGETIEQEVITITSSGALSYMLFTYGAGEACLYSMNCSPDDGSVSNYQKLVIQDWELTEKGNFYYRIYPAGDKHYADFALLRLSAPDPQLCEYQLHYINPVGYIATNLFLCDWSETDFGEMSINDLWEYLYFERTGEKFVPDECTYNPDQNSYGIPAEEFETLLLPYFNITLEQFRELARYDAVENCYPWCQLETNDFVKLWYYDIEPQVIACRENSDGTITLTVEVLSTDLKMDCVFAHEVTIRPQGNGLFQYVGNMVTQQTEYGLPYCEPRLTWWGSI